MPEGNLKKNSAGILTGRRRDALKKIIALELPLAGVIMQILVYAQLWFTAYYPLV